MSYLFETRHAIYAPQGRTIRWTPESLKQGIDGIFVNDFSICNIVVIKGENGISVTHAELHTLTEFLDAEIKWAGKNCQKFLYYRKDKADKIAAVCAQNNLKGPQKQFLYHIWSQSKITKKTWILIPVSDQVEGLLFKPIQSQEQINITTQEYPISRFPESLLRHPDERATLVASKIEEAICFGSKSFVPKQNLIFDGQYWVQLSKDEFQPKHPDVESLIQNLVYILQDYKLLKIANRLYSLQKSIFFSLPSTASYDHSFDEACKLAHYFQDYDCKQSKEQLLTLDIVDMLDDQDQPEKQEKYPIETKEDKEIITTLRKLATAEPDLKKLSETLNAYQNAPNSKFKAYLLDNYKELEMIYLVRKQYDDLAALYREKKQAFKKLAEEGAKFFSEKEYLKASLCFKKALSFAWCFVLNDKPLIKVIGNLGICLSHIEKPEEAIPFLKLNINIRKLFNINPETLEDYGKRLAECERQVKKIEGESKATPKEKAKPKEKSTPKDALLRAVLEKSPTQVEDLLKEGAAINATAPNGGKTPLHIAVEKGSEEMVKLLVTNKANVNMATEGGFTPLHVAAQKNQSQIIKLLVGSHANVNAATKVGTTPLHESAAQGHMEATVALLDLKADITSQDFRYNLTPAFLAMQQGQTQVGKFLLEKLNYHELFIQMIHWKLFNFQTIYLHYPEEKKFFQDLSTALKSKKEADEVCKVLNDTLSSSLFKPFNVKLKPQKDSLLALASKYTRDKAKADKDTLYSYSLGKTLDSKQDQTASSTSLGDTPTRTTPKNKARKKYKKR